MVKWFWYQVRTIQQRIHQSPLAQDTLWMVLAQGAQVVLQAAYFLLLARSLGVEEYGAFVGSAALVAVFVPFAGFGGGDLLIKNASRDRSQFAVYWGRAICLVLLLGTLLSIVVLGVSKIILPSTINPWIVILVAISELICYRLVVVAGQAYQSISRLKQTAKLNIFPLILRVVAAYYFSSNGGTQAVQWSVLYLLTAIVAAAVCVISVNQSIEHPKLGFPDRWSEIKESFHFALGLSGHVIYTDIDKTMLARLSTLEATGVYASAYRMIDVAFVPLRALSSASYAKFFQKGKHGIAGSWEVGKSLISASVLYGIVAAIALYVAAPFVPLVLGKEFDQTTQVLQLLALIPLIKGGHYLAANTLTGAGLQGFRSVTQAGVAVFNVLINLWLIPLYSWRGAVWSSLASDGLLLICLCLLVVWFHRKAVPVR